MKREIYAKLLEWKSRKDHKPLVLDGARQVGKTYILKEFGNKEYKTLSYVNLDKDAVAKSIFEPDHDIPRIIRTLSAHTGVDIVPKDTLIVIDEIQESAAALKTFFESKPNIDKIRGALEIRDELKHRIDYLKQALQYVYVKEFEKEINEAIAKIDSVVEKGTDAALKAYEAELDKLIDKYIDWYLQEYESVTINEFQTNTKRMVLSSDAKKVCDEKGINPYQIVEDLQPIAFENAKWAYTLGAAIAIKKGCTKAADAAKAIGEGLQAFCVPGSVADHRKVGLGHGNLGAMLLSEDAGCFAFLAGHESFAAAEGAIGIAKTANKVRKNPLRVILNGLGKDAAQIISRINGFTYVVTDYDFKTGKLNIVEEIKYGSDPERAKVKCYGADSVQEGVAIMEHEDVDISITGNSTNPTRFQHPVAGCYKKACIEKGKKYFSVASGGGTGRTLHPDNMAAGPASYGMTDTMGRMHGDAQFAGSSSVPAHVDMMGLIGAGNNPMVGMTVAVAVAVQEAMNK